MRGPGMRGYAIKSSDIIDKIRFCSSKKAVLHVGNRFSEHLQGQKQLLRPGKTGAFCKNVENWRNVIVENGDILYYST